MVCNNTFSQLMQVALGEKACLDRTLSASEWERMLALARKQAVVGLLADAIEALPDGQKAPVGVRMSCASLTIAIERQNVQANRDCVDITRRFEGRGFRCCILKGQGNALSYPNPLRRQSGDIDLWLDGGREKVVAYVKGVTREIEARIHHVEYKEPDMATPVELHYIPMFLYSFVSQRRFESYCRREMDRQMSNCRVMAKELVGMSRNGDYRISVPTADFNAVFQMVHVMRHLFEEGIGLRQIIDYYFVLKGLDSERKEDVMRVLRGLGLKRFAASLMYVLREVCGMDEKLMLCPMDVKGGRLLLDEIMMAGNFGKEDERLCGWRRKSIFHMFVWKLGNNIRYWRLCPSEVVWGPVFRVWHFCWRKINDY